MCSTPRRPSATTCTRSCTTCRRSVRLIPRCSIPFNSPRA
jgi:hypothetical protein